MDWLKEICPWLPQRILTDEAVSAMPIDVEGAYRRLLDLAWVRRGLPDDLEQLSREVKTRPATFQRRFWPLIRKHFVEDPARPGRLVNPVQEWLRAHLADVLRHFSALLGFVESAEPSKDGGFMSESGLEACAKPQKNGGSAVKSGDFFSAKPSNNASSADGSQLPAPPRTPLELELSSEALPSRDSRHPPPTPQKPASREPVAEGPEPVAPEPDRPAPGGDGAPPPSHPPTPQLEKDLEAMGFRPREIRRLLRRELTPASLDAFRLLEALAPRYEKLTSPRRWIRWAILRWRHPDDMGLLWWPEAKRKAAEGHEREGLISEISKAEGADVEGSQPWTIEAHGIRPKRKPTCLVLWSTLGLPELRRIRAALRARPLEVSRIEPSQELATASPPGPRNGALRKEVHATQERVDPG